MTNYLDQNAFITLSDDETKQVFGGGFVQIGDLPPVRNSDDTQGGGGIFNNGGILNYNDDGGR